MAETELTATECSALNGTTDSETDFKYHSPGDANYYTEGQRQRHRLLTLAKALGNRFRVYKEGQATFGVRPGKVRRGDSVLTYAGSTGNALSDDQTNYIYLHVDGGALTLATNTSGFPNPSATPHMPLATITVASGSYAVTDMSDDRQLAAFSLSSAICTRPAVKAWGAIDFTGRPADDELLTIGGRKYEMDSDGDFPQSGGDVQVDLSGNATVDEDITDIAAAINGDGSATVSAVADTTNDVLWLYAKTAGASGSSTTVTEGLSNATARAATLRDGADAALAALVNIRHTITAADAAAGHLRIDTGLTSIDGVYLSFEDSGVEAESAVTVGVSGGVLTLDEGAAAWADGDILNILAIGTE